MAYLAAIGEDEATGVVADLYAADRAQHGYVKNFTRTFSTRPAVFQGWMQLNGAIKGGMTLRRYEMATLGAARRLGSSYCMLAHGRTVAREILDEEGLRSLLLDGSGDSVDETDRAVMALGDRVAAGGAAMSEEDFAELRGLGFTDPEILDVVLAAAARCFFSTVLDATGTLPDSAYRDELSPETATALTVGRPIEEPA